MAKSDLEDKLALLIKAAGLPEPERDVTKDFIAGRRYEADFLWRFANCTCFQGLVVEVQGGIWMPPMRDRRGVARGRGHANPKKIESDCEKMCLAQLDGWLILFVTEKMINDGRAMKWIVEALALDN